MQKPKLYYAPHSSYSQRILLGLAIKEIAYEAIEVDLFDAASRAAYLAVNPFGKIPTLQTVDNQLLYESIIILEYLDQQYPMSPRLIPHDAEQALQVRFFERLIDTYINAPRNRLFLEVLHGEGTLPPKEKLRQTELLETACDLLDQQVQKGEGATPWLVGNACSVADCAAQPVLNMLQLFFDLTRYPALDDYAQNLNRQAVFGGVWQAGLPKLTGLLGQMGKESLLQKLDRG